MFWIRSGLHSISISDWLTAGPAVVVPDSGAALHDAREAMLDALGPGGERKNATLALKIRKAPDFHSLWAVRPDLMTAISRACGEAEAIRRLAQVTGYFEGILPAASTRKRKMRASLQP
jgi:hypothetical protein